MLESTPNRTSIWPSRALPHDSCAPEALSVSLCAGNRRRASSALNPGEQLDSWPCWLRTRSREKTPSLKSLDIEELMSYGQSKTLARPYDGNPMTPSHPPKFTPLSSHSIWVLP